MKKLKGNSSNPDYYIGFDKEGGLKIEWVLPYLSIIADGPEPPHDHPMEARSIRLSREQTLQLYQTIWEDKLVRLVKEVGEDN